MPMRRYMVESSHAPEDCARVLQLVHAAGFITHFDWGCKNEPPVHTGWCTFDAEDEAQAKLVVPSLIRDKARAVRLIRYDHDWSVLGGPDVDKIG